MRRQELDPLLAELADEPGPKVTITLPTHRHAPDTDQDRIRLKNLLKQASQVLEAHAHDRDELLRLRARLDEVEDRIDHRQLDHGLAVFVSAADTHVIRLAHTPVERALVSDRFATRELHRDVTETTRAWVLALSTGGNDTDGTRLYLLQRGHLDEHRDDVLPAEWDVRDRETRFAESRPDSPQRDAYIEGFLRRVDEHVAGIVGADPVVIAGVERLRSHHRAVTRVADRIVAEVDGNFDRTPQAELADAAEAALVAAQERQRDDLVAHLAEHVTSPQVTSGIDDCERLSGEARIDRLVLERSYLEPVVVDGVPIGDRVEATIRQTHEHGGTVIVVEDDTLTDLGRIAALLRW